MKKKSNVQCVNKLARMSLWTWLSNQGRMELSQRSRMKGIRLLAFKGRALVVTNQHYLTGRLVPFRRWADMLQLVPSDCRNSLTIPTWRVKAMLQQYWQVWLNPSMVTPIILLLSHDLASFRKKILALKVETRRTMSQRIYLPYQKKQMAVIRGPINHHLATRWAIQI